MKLHYLTCLFLAVCTFPAEKLLGATQAVRLIKMPALKATAITAATLPKPTGVITNHNSRVAFNVSTAHPTAMKLLVHDGTKFRSSTNLASHSPNTVEVDVPLNVVYYLVPTNIDDAPLSTNEVLLPGLICMNLSPTETISGQVAVKLNSTEMEWDSKTENFTTQLRLWVQSTNRTDRAKALLKDFVPIRLVPSPVTGITLNPDTVQLTNLGGVYFKTVNLTCEPRIKEAVIELVSELGGRRLKLHMENLSVTEQVNRFMEVPLLLTTLISGGAAGLIRSLQGGKSKRRRRSLLVAEGMFVALVFVTALSAGLQIGSANATTVQKLAGAFAVAALAGYGGAHLLERFANGIFFPEDKKKTTD
jgi:hypothetical protein